MGMLDTPFQRKVALTLAIILLAIFGIAAFIDMKQHVTKVCSPK